MKNILFYSTSWKGAQECLQIEEAVNQYKAGNNVYWIYCDRSLEICYDNPRSNKGMCLYCERYQKKIRKQFLPGGIKQIPISSLIDSKIIEKANIEFKYSSADEMREIEFDGVEIGMGCLSSYVTKTRNVDPLISKETKPYFDRILRSEILLTLAIEKLLKKERIDLIVFHNGRFAQYKPLLNIAKKYKIDYICTECMVDSEGGIHKNFFYNTIPHDPSAIKENIFKVWDNYDPVERDKLGKLFYEKRRANVSTGDVVYTSSQQSGLLPEDWDPERENIVIFNSSEDEFSAIGKDFNIMKLYKTQLEGIKALANHYKSDKSKKFYLRIHPNLKDIRFKYNKDLLQLDFPNLTVIPGDSAISTYTLMDNADKVIAFGSTAGIEAVYRHKPLIILGPTEYYDLGVSYIPKTEEELWNYIDTPDLEDRFNENVIKFGFYYMAAYESKILERCKNIDSTLVKYDFGGRHYFLITYQKILGSNLLYLIHNGIMRKFCALFFKETQIPEKER